MDSLTILQRYFGYEAFRPGQQEIISSITAKHDSLVLLATGGGKSICFQVPALLFTGCTIVISPLISLMSDQVMTLRKKGIAAGYLASSLSSAEKKQVMQDFLAHKLKLLYMSPEKFNAMDWKSISLQVEISHIVIDEAHCVITWGTDFRPEYQQLASRWQQFATRPVITAFTATATPATQRLLIHAVQLTSPDVHRFSSRRSNLTILVHHCHTLASKELHLWHILHQHLNSSGILYCATRKACEQLTTKIKRIFPKQQIEYYHAGRSGAERSQIQDAYMAGKLQWLVSTNAFGMGVDKADIRFVVHFEPSTSVENYFQEIGRAGRDRQPSWCYLLWRDADWLVLAELLEDADQKTTLMRHQHLKKLILYTQKKECRHRQLLTYFGEKMPTKNCHQCDVCINWAERLSVNESLIRQRLATIKTKYPRVRPFLTQTQHQIAFYQPVTKAQFLTIPGIGQGWLEKWWPILEPLLPMLYQSTDVDIVHHQ